ncbi:hypothetical protein [Polluticaenibacter yanchengensis]|uniref:Lipoprotein n=1 Tax=Polluticaenibacter yanchengensis TaxID=3014562 RepID=A0ABT4UML8_9BACT|nr:hypothetical protein [Chitinophagaceae bacterium LY-5]
MRKLRLPAFLGLFTFGACLFLACKKDNNYRNTQNVEEKSIFSKDFPELSLKLEYKSSKLSSDSAAITLSSNFTLKHMSSIYNKEQQLEYFVFVCEENNMNRFYVVNGTINNTGKLTIDYQKLNTEN